EDDDVPPDKRAAYSRRFRKADDNRYVVTVHRDTIQGDRRDNLKTERLHLTLARDTVSSEWAVASEDVQDTFEQLYRTMPGDETFHRFGMLMFDQEGFHLTATNGMMFHDYRHGELVDIWIWSKDLSYDYQPPRDLEYQQRVNAMILEDHPKDFVFEPELARIQCFPASCRELITGYVTGLEQISREQLPEVLNEAYEDFVDDEQEAREENPFSGFTTPPEASRRQFAVGVKKPRRDHWVGLFYDNREPWEVTFYASTYTPPRIFGYHSEATRNSGLNPYELESREDVFSQDYEIVGLSGVVELGLDDSESMRGDVTYKMRTLRELDYLDFYLAEGVRILFDVKEMKDQQLIVNSIEMDDGQELTWLKTGGTSGRIVLPQRVAKDSEITLRMDFENRNCIYDLNDSYSGMDRGGWIPFVRFSDMIDEFDMTVKVPAKYKTLGIGTKVDERIEGEVSVTKWVAERPVVFATVIFGDYIVFESETKAKKLDGRPIPVVMHVDKLSMMDWGVTPKQLKPFAEQAANSINLFTQIFGVDYPYGRLDLVNDPLVPIPYGQAPSSIIYLGTLAFRPPSFLNEVFSNRVDSERLSRNLRALVPHEVAHQWWGSTIANGNFRHYWFIESLAEYSAALYMEFSEGPEAYKRKLDDWRDVVLESDLMSSVQDASAVWSGDGFDTYFAAVYNKGPYALHMMRETFGDERFFPFLKTLAMEFAGKEIVSRDIQRVAEASFGMQMDWFFDQWIRGIGIPDFRLSYDTRQTEDGQYLVQGKVIQRVVVGKDKHELDQTYFVGRVPLTIEARGGKKYRTLLTVQGPETPFQLKVPEKPTKIMFNENGELLAHNVREGTEF
ncbi:MAG: hypothetical protein JSV80_01160, partial [Acidobacteriota bacterium]